MNELGAFTNARLDEEEAAAKAAADGPWSARDMSVYGWSKPYSGHHEVLVIKHTWPQEAAHIVLHDPKRALRDIENKRAILAEHPHVETLPPLLAGGVSYGCTRCHDAYGVTQPLGYCRTVRLLIARWDDHPDYDENWKP